jgi:hypothetical protein
MHASALDYSWPDKSKDCVVQSFDGYSSYLLIVYEASRLFGISSQPQRNHCLLSSESFLPNTATAMVGRYIPIRVANLPSAPPSRTCCYRTFTIRSNLPVQTVFPRMEQLKYIMTSFRSGCKCCSMALDYQPNTGLQPSCIQSTFITVWYIWQPRQHRLKDTMVNHRIFLPSSYLALGCVSNGQVIGAARWIATTSPESSSDIPPWIKTSSILIWTLDWSNTVTMCNSTKRDISNHIVLRLHSSFMILAWKMTTRLSFQFKQNPPTALPLLHGLRFLRLCL